MLVADFTESKRTPLQIRRVGNVFRPADGFWMLK